MLSNDLSVCAKTHIPKIVNTKIAMQQQKENAKKENWDWRLRKKLKGCGS
jgi:hypothetical protein